MFNELKNAKNINELKQLYKKLAMIHHPDRGGDTRKMQELNSLYETLFNTLKKTEKQTNKNFKENENANDFINIINRVVAEMGNDPTITIELIGSWLWISGVQRGSHYHKVMNELKFIFNGKKQMWYFTNDEQSKGFKHKPIPMDQIREKYGSSILKGKENDKLN